MSKTKKTKLEIDKVLIVSTLHVTLNESNLLEQHGYGRAYGWLVALDTRGKAICPEWKHRSPGFAGIVRVAKANGCRYVLFDRDGQVIPDVPSYDW